MKSFLNEQVRLFNTQSFVETDPVQFPKRYTMLQDIEIAAFAVSTITWGKREMILRNANNMLAKMDNSPYSFVMNGNYNSLGNANIHRTFFENDLIYLLRGFHKILLHNESIECFLKKHHVQNAWEINAVLQKEMANANGGAVNSKIMPVNFEKSPLKRLNLALRWLVRNDGIVDLGIWKILKPSQLYIPLDVHVARIARELGILKRKQNDRYAVEELTTVLRTFCPKDPVKYDFALFGIGIAERKLKNNHILSGMPKLYEKQSIE